MKRIVRTSVADEAARMLKAELSAGRWTGRLPGTRVLAELCGISQPTMAGVLSRLADEGWIERSGDRRAYRTTGRTGEVPAGGTEGNGPVVILTHVEPGDLPDTTRKVIDELRALLSRRGRVVEFRVVDFVHCKRPHKSWDHSIPADPATPVIAVFGRPVLAEWAGKSGARMLFLGGVGGEHGIPMVGLRSATMVDEAFARLIALGHRRIVMPLCERIGTFSSALKEVVKRRLEDAGIAYVPAYHTPESDYLTPEVTRAIMTSVFARKEPTALVFLDWKELVAASCWLWERGLRVPEDVSVLLLNDQTEAEWYAPKLARFRFPVRRMARMLLSWVEGRPVDPGAPPLRADFEEGDSLAPPGRA